MTHVELFAGAGGFALGVEQAGFENVGCIEKDKYCCETLRSNRKDWKIYQNDITTFDFKDLECEQLDLLTFGFPCQPFSYAGKCKGMADTRGTLFYECARALRELKPKAFIAENVTGLVTHDKGKTLETILKVFEDAGYNVEYKVLCASWYGVAQRRKRLFMVGFRKDLDVDFTYPAEDEKETILGDVLKDVPESEGVEYTEKKKCLFELIPEGGNWHSVPYEKVKHYVTGKDLANAGGQTGMLRRLTYKKPSPTLLTSPMQKRTEFCHPEHTRPLTVREYARVQSFPDWYKFHGSVLNQYKQIGNAVPPVLAYRVAEQVRIALESRRV